MDLLYTIARRLREPASPNDCAPLDFSGSVGMLEHWCLVPTPDGPYLIEGVLKGREVTAVVIAIYSRTIARLAQRWVVLGRPLDDRWPEFDEADLIRRAAHWIVRMDAREEAGRSE
jgi:hypothetical protein